MSRNKGGRPAHEPTDQSRRQVEAMAGYGVPAEDIGRVLGIDAKTLRKHYREELDTGRVKANSKVAEALYRKATGDGSQSVAAAIFWLKTRAGWRETNNVELTGKDGGPIQTEEVSARDIIAGRIAGIAARVGTGGGSGGTDGDAG